MTMSRRWPLLLTLMLSVILAACAASGGANTSWLLEQDYQRMTNPQLTAYEQELSDEIARSAQADTGGGVSLGFGFGSWGGHSGVGVGVDKHLGGGGGSPAVELSDRREAVRVEMRRRGLLPSS